MELYIIHCLNTYGILNNQFCWQLQNPDEIFEIIDY